MQKQEDEKTGDAKSKKWEFSDATAPLREFVASVSPKNNGAKWAGLGAIALVCAYMFSIILSASLSAMGAALSSALLFLVCGEIMRGWMGWGGFWGLILFRDRSILGFIDRIAHKYEDVWIALSDIGLVLGYGLFSILLLGGEQRKMGRLAVMYAGGLSLLLVFSIFVAPMSMAVMNGMLTGGDFQGASAHIRQSVAGFDAASFDINGKAVKIPVFSIMMLAVLLVGGLAGSITISLLAYAAIILPAVLGKILAMLVALAGGEKFSVDGLPPPGGAPILPGVNLPFVEGIIALAILLAVHEIAHALLARIANIRLDSAGIVFFGILPFGAFVEPDEKEMEKVEKYKQNRIIVAGSAANIITCILFFFLLTAAIWGTQEMRLGGFKVIDGNLPKGAVVYSVDSQEYKGQNLSLAAGASVIINTSFGEFSRVADENGKLGVDTMLVQKSGAGFRYAFRQGWGWIEFVLNILALAFSLNLFVGIANLLPIPLFDGQRLMEAGVGNKRLALAVGVAVSAAFFVNLLPWIFK